MSDDEGAQLVAVAFGAEDPAGLARFWAHALGWEVGDESGGRIELVPTDGTRLTLVFEPASADQTNRTRLHLDLTTASLVDQMESAAQLVELGGRHVDIGQTPEEGHLVLADPEGNLFCLIEPDNGFLADCPRLGAINGDGNRATGVFWSQALSWPLVWDQDDETAIRAPDGTGPMITWGGPPLNEKHGANRLHLDLAPGEGRDHEAEIARLLGIGATRTGSTDAGITLRDPDANEFRLLDRVDRFPPLP